MTQLSSDRVGRLTMQKEVADRYGQCSQQTVDALEEYIDEDAVRSRRSRWMLHKIVLDNLADYMTSQPDDTSTIRYAKQAVYAQGALAAFKALRPTHFTKKNRQNSGDRRQPPKCFRRTVRRSPWSRLPLLDAITRLHAKLDFLKVRVERPLHKPRQFVYDWQITIPERTNSV
jgi:hypothetical protein